MTLIRRCEACMGTGSIESSDSTDESWWDCSACKGTGKIEFEDRRAPDPRLAGAVEALRTLHRTDPARTLAACDEADPSNALSNAVAPSPHRGQ